MIILIDKTRLYDDRYPLNNNLFIKNPTVRDVLEFDEEKYNQLINIFLVYPVDLIVELDDMGFPDFEVFSQYDIFIMLYRSNEDLFSELMKFFFGDLSFYVAQYKDSQEVVLFDKEHGAVFDLTSYMIMSHYIREIHNIPEDVSKLAHKGKMLKKTMLEVERANREYLREQAEKDRLSGKTSHRLQKYITKMSVASRYSRDDLINMKLYEFYKTMYEIIGFQYWKFNMLSVHTGAIERKKFSKKELDWFFD